MVTLSPVDPFFFLSLVPSTNTIDTVSEEDQLKVLAHQRMKKEYKNAVQVEGMLKLLISKDASTLNHFRYVVTETFSKIFDVFVYRFSVDEP